MLCRHRPSHETFRPQRVLGGALAPIISIALLGRFSTWVAVSVYIAAMLVITIGAVVAAQETSRIDLHAEKPQERAILERAG